MSIDFHIRGSHDATEFVPTVPTYAIRINNSGIIHPGDRFDFSSKDFRLQESGLWVAVREYVFDDVRSVDYDPSEALPITDDLAAELLYDFFNLKVRCSAVMIHCSKGVSRSPAVGIALSKILGLRKTTRDLVASYPDYNELVYQTIIAAGRRLRMIS